MTIWYSVFRHAAYSYLAGFIIWTALFILPFSPFTYLLPILVRGGPGIWLILGYLLNLTVGVIGSGMLSSLIYTIEIHEKRVINRKLMISGFTILNGGIISSCVLLATAGALGGYAIDIGGASELAAQGLLTAYVYPITITVIMAIVGAALTLLTMIGAKAPVA